VWFSRYASGQTDKKTYSSQYSPLPEVWKRTAVAYIVWIACADVKSLPGYQAIPTNCPLWKRAMIEKKNGQLEADAMV